MKPRPLTRWSALAAVLAVVILIGFALSRSRLAIASDGIPLAQVKHGDLDLKVHANGELNATHTMMLTAPAVGGGALQITRLLAGRLPVKKGDVVIEFDPSEQRYKLEQSRSELLQAEQEITKAKADAAVLKAQDKVALLKARYDVRTAELDVQKKEIVSAIDAAKNDAALKQAKQLLAELERDIESHNKSGQASVYLSPGEIQQVKTGDGSSAAKYRQDERHRTDGWTDFHSKKHGCLRRFLFYRHVGTGLPCRRPGASGKRHRPGSRSNRTGTEGEDK